MFQRPTFLYPLWCGSDSFRTDGWSFESVAYITMHVVLSKIYSTILWNYKATASFICENLEEMSSSVLVVGSVAWTDGSHCHTNRLSSKSDRLFRFKSPSFNTIILTNSRADLYLILQLFLECIFIAMKIRSNLTKIELDTNKWTFIRFTPLVKISDH